MPWQRETELPETPKDWEKRINGNAPDEPDVVPVIGRIATSASKWKRAEHKNPDIPQSEERMDRWKRKQKGKDDERRNIHD